MRMADSRSLLASLTSLVSALLPSLCPARCKGTTGGGSGGGGGPGGGGTIRGPRGGGTGGSGYPGPTCKTPLCGLGGSAPRGKPKAVWADGMGGPGTGGGGAELFDSKRKRIMLLEESYLGLSVIMQQTNILVIWRKTSRTIHAVCSTGICCGIGYSLVVYINAVVFMLHRWRGVCISRDVIMRLGKVISSVGGHWRDRVV